MWVGDSSKSPPVEVVPIAGGFARGMAPTPRKVLDFLPIGQAFLLIRE